jgi:hypothetical protein
MFSLVLTFLLCGVVNFPLLLAKFLVFYAIIRLLRSLKEPLDGVLQAAAVALARQSLFGAEPVSQPEKALPLLASSWREDGDTPAVHFRLASIYARLDGRAHRHLRRTVRRLLDRRQPVPGSPERDRRFHLYHFFRYARARV